MQMQTHSVDTADRLLYKYTVMLTRVLDRDCVIFISFIINIFILRVEI